MLRASETPSHSIPRRFRYQVVLAAGGAQGIGKAIATRLAKEGTRLVIGDIHRQMMTQTASEVAAGVIHSTRPGSPVGRLGY